MKMTEGAEAGEAGLLVEIGAGQKDRGREQQLVREMWLGSRREQWEMVRNVTGYTVFRLSRPP